MAGELSLVPDRTPERPDGHESRGQCGGQLHGICGETKVRGAGAPPTYVELSSQFVSLKSAAAVCGKGDAAIYLDKARMTFIKAHAS